MYRALLGPARPLPALLALAIAVLGLAVIGSNFGQPNTPAWVLNLEAEPRATAAYKQRTIPVVARPASEDEAHEVMERSRAIYGGYEKYVQRISGRRVRILVLESA